MKTCVWFLLLLVGGRLAARPEVSLLTPATPAAPGAVVAVQVAWLNPGAAAESLELPEVIAGRLAAGGHSWPLELTAPAPTATVVAPGSFAAKRYTLVVPPAPPGSAVIELEGPWAARGVLEVAGAPPVGPAPPAAVVTPPPASGPPADISWRVFGGHFSPHLPIYFLMGADKPAAKFQFSFKYRIWGSGENAAMPAEPPHGVYFGYTQRSVWDITAYSSPFYDTSYMPELLYQYRPPNATSPGWQWHGFQTAVQHESNGKAGPDSRSMNLIYLKPTVGFATRNGWQFLFTPKVFTYIGGLSDNPDLPRYRGYGEYTLTILKRNVALALTGRIGSHGDRGSLEGDLTVPVKLGAGDFATFLLVQYFDGYGESLLDYRSKSHTVRAGVSLVR